MKRTKSDKWPRKYKTFIKVLRSHHPDMIVSYNPPFGSACAPAYLNDKWEPIGEALIQRAIKQAKM